MASLIKSRHSTTKIIEITESDSTNSTECTTQTTLSATTTQQWQRSFQEKVDVAARACECGYFEQAYTAYSEAIGLDPRNHVLFSNRSAICCRLGLYEQALNDADTAMCLQPGWVKAWYRRGIALKGLDRLVDALVAFCRGLSQDSNNQQLFTALRETACDLNMKDRIDAAQLQLCSLAIDFSPFLLVSIVGQELLVIARDETGSNDAMQSAIEILHAALTIGTTSLKLRQSVLSALSSAYWLSGQTERAMEFMQQDLGVTRSLGDTIGELRAHCNMGNALVSIGRHGDALAHYRHMLSLAVKLNDQSYQADALSALGGVYASLGDHLNAAASHRQCLRLLPAEGNAAAAEYSALGQAQLRLCEFGDAEMCFASQLAAAVDDAERARAQCNMGLLHQQQGASEQALQSYNAALIAARASGDRQVEARVLAQFASVNRSQRNYTAAKRFAERLLQLSLRLHDRVMECEACDCLGSIYEDLTDYHAALKLALRQQHIASSLGDSALLARAAALIGNSQCGLGKYDEALQSYASELQYGSQMSDMSAQAVAHGHLARCQLVLGNLDAALASLQCQLNLAREVSDVDALSAAYCSLGDYFTQYTRDNVRHGIEQYEKYEAIAKERNDVEAQRNACSRLGGAYASLHEWKTAIEQYERELALAKDLKDHASLCRIYRSLGEAQRASSMIDAALDSFKWSLAFAHICNDMDAKFETLSLIGQVLQQRGSNNQALKVYGKQLTLARLIERSDLERAAFGHLGDAYAALGEADRALSFYQQQQSMCVAADDAAGQVRVLDSIGRLYETLKLYRKALHIFEQQASLSQKLSAKHRTLALANSARIYSALLLHQNALNKHEERIRIIHAAIECGECSEGNLNEAEFDAASSRLCLGQVSTAILSLQSILNSNNETGIDRTEVSKLLITCLLSTARFDEALVIALSLKEACKESLSAQSISNELLALCYASLGAFEDCLSHSNEPLFLLMACRIQQIPTDNLSISKYQLALVCESLGDYTMAFQTLSSINLVEELTFSDEFVTENILQTRILLCRARISALLREENASALVDECISYSRLLTRPDFSTVQAHMLAAILLMQQQDNSVESVVNNVVNTVDFKECMAHLSAAVEALVHCAFPFTICSPVSLFQARYEVDQLIAHLNSLLAVILLSKNCTRDALYLLERLAWQKNRAVLHTQRFAKPCPRPLSQCDEEFFTESSLKDRPILVGCGDRRAIWCEFMDDFEVAVIQLDKERQTKGTLSDLVQVTIDNLLRDVQCHHDLASILSRNQSQLIDYSDLALLEHYANEQRIQYSLLCHTQPPQNDQSKDVVWYSSTPVASSTSSEETLDWCMLGSTKQTELSSVHTMDELRSRLCAGTVKHILAPVDVASSTSLSLAFGSPHCSAGQFSVQLVDLTQNLTTDLSMIDRVIFTVPSEEDYEKLPYLSSFIRAFLSLGVHSVYVGKCDMEKLDDLTIGRTALKNFLCYRQSHIAVPMHAPVADEEMQATVDKVQDLTLHDRFDVNPRESLCASLREILQTPDDCHDAFRALLHLCVKCNNRIAEGTASAPMYTTRQSVRRLAGPEVNGWIDLLAAMGFQLSEEEALEPERRIFFPKADPHGLLAHGIESLSNMLNISRNGMAALSALSQNAGVAVVEAVLVTLTKIPADLAASERDTLTVSPQLWSEAGVQPLFVSLGFDLLQHSEYTVLLRSLRPHLTIEATNSTRKALEALFADVLRERCFSYELKMFDVPSCMPSDSEQRATSTKRLPRAARKVRGYAKARALAEGYMSEGDSPAKRKGRSQSRGCQSEDESRQSQKFHKSLMPSSTAAFSSTTLPSASNLFGSLKRTKARIVNSISSVGWQQATPSPQKTSKTQSFTRPPKSSQRQTVFEAPQPDSQQSASLHHQSQSTSLHHQSQSTSLQHQPPHQSTSLQQHNSQSTSLQRQPQHQHRHQQSSASSSSRDQSSYSLPPRPTAVPVPPSIQLPATPCDTSRVVSPRMEMGQLNNGSAVYDTPPSVSSSPAPVVRNMTVIRCDTPTDTAAANHSASSSIASTNQRASPIDYRHTNGSRAAERLSPGTTYHHIGDLLTNGHVSAAASPSANQRSAASPSANHHSSVGSPSANHHSAASPSANHHSAASPSANHRSAPPPYVPRQAQQPPPTRLGHYNVASASRLRSQSSIDGYTIVHASEISQQDVV